VSQTETPRLDRLQAELAEGDIDGARRALLELSRTRSNSFGRRWGRRRSSGPAARLREGDGAEAQEGQSRASWARTDSVELGDSDRIWINFVRLISGRIGDLELTLEESQKPGLHVRTAGVHRKTYVSILMELDTRWHVRPFAFDWREDIDRSAARLDGEIKAFGAGEPVHLIAHSMGGLVARRFIQLFPDLWASMNDPERRGRGGRLVMLGTPNRGSFAIAARLHRREKVVRTLAKADLDHSLDEILAIIATFPGLYQMLPSPHSDLDGNQHTQLFERPHGRAARTSPSWTTARVPPRDLEEIVDPERLVYVAGYDRPTPFAVRVDAPGQFSYGRRAMATARAPRAGPAQGVATYWSTRCTATWSKNGLVLDAISDLLQRGETEILAARKPVSRGVAREPQPGRRTVEPVPAEVDRILAKAKARRQTTAAPTSHPRKRCASRTSSSPSTSAAAGRRRFRPPSRQRDSPEESAAPDGTVGVVWGDVTKVDADVYTVGHYQGVLPRTLSWRSTERSRGFRTARARPLAPRRHAANPARCSAPGALGDVDFFPWGDRRNAGRTVAIAGMGRPGTFDARALRRLVREPSSPSPRCRTSVPCAASDRLRRGALRPRGRSRSSGRDRGRRRRDRRGPALAGVAPVNRLIIAERERGQAREIPALRTAPRERG
jgi:pimeloyl-ACP methyl ester carboxylesterase